MCFTDYYRNRNKNENEESCHTTNKDRHQNTECVWGCDIKGIFPHSLLWDYHLG